MLVGIVTLSGCATRGFVQQELAPIEARVSELESTSEEHAERIDAVDSRAQEGISLANNAAQAAQTAQQGADQAGQDAAAAGRQAEAAQQSADQAGNQVGALANRFDSRGNYSVARTVSVQFALNSAALSDAGMATLGGITGQIQQRDRLEVQGFTDSTGDDGYNIGLSQRRAGVVVRYLVSQGVDLFRITVIGLGEASPTADNSTREGREQNRRVEVRLLRAN
jgi:OOP family OmpA-OmpF porin